VLDIEIPFAEVSATTERIYEQIRKNAQIPGFRAGKAPLDMIKKNYQAACREKVVDDLLQRSIMPVFKKQGIEPVAFPSVDNVNFDFDRPFSYKMTVEQHPTVKVKDYKGIKVTKEIHPVTEKNVNEAIDALRERNARLADSAATAATEKHLLLTDYTATCEGQEIKDLKAANQLIDLNVGQMMPGLKEGLLGMAKGSTKDISVAFPPDHPNKKLAGKNVIFNVTVKEIKEKILPELNDEFAKDMGLGALGELQAKVKESLEAEEARRQKHGIEKQLIDSLLESNKFEVPNSLIEDQLGRLMKNAEDYFKEHGLPETAYKKKIEEEKDKYKIEAERNVRLSYIFNAIIDEEKLAVTDADLAAENQKILSGNAGKEKEVEKYIKENSEKIKAIPIFGNKCQNQRRSKEVKLCFLYAKRYTLNAWRPYVLSTHNY
jgi:trigger factor